MPFWLSAIFVCDLRGACGARHASHKFWKICLKLTGVQSYCSVLGRLGGMPPGPRPIRSFRLVRRCRVRVRVGRVRVGGVRVSRVSGEVGLGEG